MRPQSKYEERIQASAARPHKRCGVPRCWRSCGPAQETKERAAQGASASPLVESTQPKKRGVPSKKQAQGTPHSGNGWRPTELLWLTFLCTTQLIFWLAGEDRPGDGVVWPGLRLPGDRGGVLLAVWREGEAPLKGDVLRRAGEAPLEFPPPGEVSGDVGVPASEERRPVHAALVEHARPRQPAM